MACPARSRSRVGRRRRVPKPRLRRWLPKQTRKILFRILIPICSSEPGRRSRYKAMVRHRRITPASLRGSRRMHPVVITVDPLRCETEIATSVTIVETVWAVPEQSQGTRCGFLGNDFLGNDRERYNGCCRVRAAVPSLFLWGLKEWPRKYWSRLMARWSGLWS